MLLSVVEATKRQFIQEMRSIENSSILLGRLIGIHVSGTNHMLARGLSVRSEPKIHQAGKTLCPVEFFAVVVLPTS
jgi:hypothetical protein